MAGEWCVWSVVCECSEWFVCGVCMLVGCIWCVYICVCIYVYVVCICVVCVNVYVWCVYVCGIFVVSGVL